MSDKCIKMILRLPRYGEQILRAKSKSLCRCLQKSRKKISRNTQNERLERITPTTIRRWKVNELYRKLGGNIVKVSSWLGHKNLNTTRRYIYDDKDSDFSVDMDVQHAVTLEECEKLLKMGYSYVMKHDEYSIFTKPI